MNHPTTDQLTALREEIRKAGRRTLKARYSLAAAFGMLALILSGTVWFIAGQRLQHLAPDPQNLDRHAAWVQNTYAVFAAIFGLPFALLCAGVVAFAVAALYRLRAAEHLRSLLADLPAKDAAAVLTPLLQERGDTKRIVGSLIRDLKVPTEVTPAATPAGRGDEMGAEPWG